MNYFPWIIKFALSSSFLLLSCTSTNKRSLETKIIENYLVDSENIILILDIDRCNSCGVENEKFILNNSIGVKSTILVLSSSKKKADIFMSFTKREFIWDSLRVGEPYLKNQSYFIYEKN